MRAHTALHLLSVVLPYPSPAARSAKPKGGSISIPARPPSTAPTIEARLAELVATDAAVTTRWITDAELEANPGLVKTMKVKPPTGSGRVRLVEIAGLDLQPCGGTHVARLSEIGRIEVTGIEKKGKQNRRVRIKLPDPGRRSSARWRGGGEMSNDEPGFSTLSIHAGARPDPTTGARITPIYQTTAFVFDDVDHAASLFGLQAFGNIYSRITNPTCAALEERVAALEGAPAALAVASGHAAQMLVFHTLMRPGDEFVASTKLYGGSINQFNHAFKNYDWRVKWANPDEPDSFKAAINERTRAIFIESIANPGGVVCDVDAIAKIARDARIPLIVDNTLATPYLMRAAEHGADIIVHSATKFLGGHGNSMGGIIVDCGSFDWLGDPRYPCCRRRGRNTTAWCSPRPSAISASPSPAGCWACAISGRRCRRSTRS